MRSVHKKSLESVPRYIPVLVYVFTGLWIVLLAHSAKLVAVTSLPLSTQIIFFFQVLLGFLPVVEVVKLAFGRRDLVDMGLTGRALVSCVGMLFFQDWLTSVYAAIAVIVASVCFIVFAPLFRN